MIFMSRKYTQCMERIYVDAQMRDRLLRSAREVEDEDAVFPSHRKKKREASTLRVLRIASSIAACVVLVLIVSLGARFLRQQAEAEKGAEPVMVETTAETTGVETARTSEEQVVKAAVTGPAPGIIAHLLESDAGTKAQGVDTAEELSELAGFPVNELTDLSQEGDQVSYAWGEDGSAQVTYHTGNGTIITITKVEKADTDPTQFSDRPGVIVSEAEEGEEQAVWDAGNYAYRLDVSGEAEEADLLQLIETINAGAGHQSVLEDISLVESGTETPEPTTDVEGTGTPVPQEEYSNPVERSHDPIQDMQTQQETPAWRDYGLQEGDVEETFPSYYDTNPWKGTLVDDRMVAADAVFFEDEPEEPPYYLSEDLVAGEEGEEIGGMIEGIDLVASYENELPSEAVNLVGDEVGEG